jgi:hypothetical protein
MIYNHFNLQPLYFLSNGEDLKKLSIKYLHPISHITWNHFGIPKHLACTFGSMPHSY